MGERLALDCAFTGAAVRYWLTVFPQVCRELAHWRRRAAAIPDPVLRGLAVDAFGKRGNIEGAAAFAVLAPRARRRTVVRALVALQSVYNYADLLSEQPSADPVADARSLHGALLVALDSTVPHLDYYQHHSRHDDGGYLAELIDACRATLGALPSYPLVVRCAESAAERIVAFQSLSAGERSEATAGASGGSGIEPRKGDGAREGRESGAGEGRGDLERWAREQTPAGCELEWWETAAAGGSSLGMHALVALSAQPALDRETVTAVEHAYFPWIGAVHSLLDSVVDESEDAKTGQLSLLGCYESRVCARERMGWIARRAFHVARELPCGRRHAVVMAGMVGYYASAAQMSGPGVIFVPGLRPADPGGLRPADPGGLRPADSPEGAEPVLDGVVYALGPVARRALLVFDFRRRLARVARGTHVGRPGSRGAACCRWKDGEGVDARAA